MKKLILLSILFIVGCEETLEPQDCAGVAGGTAELDNCNVCDSDKINDCVPDCAGVWGGTAVIDSCGGCDVDTTNDCIQDCNGDYGGTAVEDECGICDSDLTNDCTQDCAGVWGGTSNEDECGTCDNDSSNDCCVDIDGNIYETTQVGEQLWMAENLKVTHYRDGSYISTGYNNSNWMYAGGAFAVYDDNYQNLIIYGNLYNFDAVKDSRGICPIEWHIPSDTEWENLSSYLGDDSASQLAGDINLWNNGILSDNIKFGISGFNALPAGNRNENGLYDNIGFNAYFWSSSLFQSNLPWIRTLYSGNAELVRLNSSDNNGYSIRCLKD